MNRYIIIVTFIFCSLLSWGQHYTQIITKEQAVIDTFYNKFVIRDNYRWLENTRSKDINEWMSQQKDVCEKYLNRAVFNSDSYNSIDKYSFVKYNNPQRQGDYYFTYATYNEGVPALFYQTDINDDPIPLVDPNFISSKDKIVLTDFSVSKNSKLLAYQFNRNGSDWSEVNVVSLQTRNPKKDHLQGLKFSNISWLGDGFFYTTVSQKGQFGTINDQKIYYHKIGAEQQSDSTVFSLEADQSEDRLNYLTTSDERFIVIKKTDKETKSSNYYFIDYSLAHPTLKPLLTNIKKHIDVLDSKNGKLIASATTNSDYGSIIEIDPENPSQIRTIVPERKDTLLLKVNPFNDRIVAFYQTNEHPLVVITDYSGNILQKLRFPVGSSVSGFEGNFKDEEVLFDYCNYTTPSVVYKFNLKTFKKELVKKTSINYSIDKIEYKTVEYISKDSIKIPMILVYEKGIKLDGNNPTILKAYGGFGIVQTPSFDPGIVYFIKQGGVYAFANIRGGGDKGFNWALQGRGENKQKSFDDFISAAEYLINSSYTNSKKLAATGVSNGGLVVAVAAIQRPDLFKAVVPVVAPLDMIRFNKFTVGNWWTDEYGAVNDSLGFARIHNYSPYHNIKDNINYPAMLLVTSENDDRVPPFNSYKFAAKLQSRTAQKNPIILKIEKNSGHNGATTFLSRIQAKADIYGFIMNELMKK